MKNRVRELLMSKLSIEKLMAEQIYFKSIQERRVGKVVNKRFYKIVKDGVIAVNTTQPSISKISPTTFNQAHAGNTHWLSGSIDFATKEEFEEALKIIKKEIGV
jgi:hypothetical protein